MELLRELNEAMKNNPIEVHIKDSKGIVMRLSTTDFMKNIDKESRGFSMDGKKLKFLDDYIKAYNANRKSVGSDERAEIGWTKEAEKRIKKGK